MEANATKNGGRKNGDVKKSNRDDRQGGAKIEEQVEKVRLIRTIFYDLTNASSFFIWLMIE